MTPQRRLEIEQHANLYGSANCWAGTSGTLATMIRELLSEIDRLNMGANDGLATQYVHATYQRKGESSVVQNRPDNAARDSATIPSAY